MVSYRTARPDLHLGFVAAVATILLIGAAVSLPRNAGTKVGPDGPARQPMEAGSPWMVYIRKVDEALARKDISSAEMAWQHANGEALRSRAWDGMVEVGDAALRIGDAAGLPKMGKPRARQAYLAALFWARDRGSLDGVFRVAESFAKLGDEEVVRQCLRVAEGLAATGRELQARDRLLAFRQQLAFRFPGVARTLNP